MLPPSLPTLYSLLQGRIPRYLDELAPLGVRPPVWLRGEGSFCKGKRDKHFPLEALDLGNNIDKFDKGVYRNPANNEFPGRRLGLAKRKGDRDGMPYPTRLALVGPRPMCGTTLMVSVRGACCGGFVHRRRETSDSSWKSRDICAGGEPHGAPERPPRQTEIDRDRRGCCRGRGGTMGCAIRNALPRGKRNWMAMRMMPIPQSWAAASSRNGKAA